MAPVAQGAEVGVCPRGCHNDEICVDVADKCHRCVKKTATCPEGTIIGVCNPSVCSSDQKCVDAGDICHTCHPKKKTCEDMGMNDGETYTRLCQEGTCVKMARMNSVQPAGNVRPV